MNRINHDAISSSVACSCWRNDTICLVEKTLVVRRVVLFVESGGESKVGQFDVAIFVNKNVIGLYVTIVHRLVCVRLRIKCKSIPMNKAHFVDGLDGEYALCHIETSDVLRKSVVLDQHCHKISTGEELHNEIEIRGILERVKQLDDPWGVRFGKNVALSANVCKLEGKTCETQQYILGE